ncbi:MAG: hypothetical protein KJ718_05615 [Nanoarchaeota archaeon]|nr:hypothetical protein [Nanoarchaeota archaeon]MBU1052001.1 hypothetical protein [Nanoarchaeota archaeon]MBU1988716.1 hypothetical protein [Nanoarchaeota archaeon]
MYTPKKPTMKDIFDAKISCKNCNVEMKPMVLIKKGFKLRAVNCPKCNEGIVHPFDLHKLQHYNDLKRKTYKVKLRVVGNSHAISIPKEIVNFINEMNSNMSRHMNDMVHLCLEDFGKLSLDFIHNQDQRKKW